MSTDNATPTPTATLGETPTETPTPSLTPMDSIMRISSILHRTDYWRRGRTLEKLGIDNLSVGELTLYVNQGIREQN